MFKQGRGFTWGWFILVDYIRWILAKGNPFEDSGHRRRNQGEAGSWLTLSCMGFAVVVFRSADSLQENVFNRRNVSVWRTENTRSQLPTKINPSQLSSESKNQPLSLSYLYSFFYFGIPDKCSNQSMSKDSSRISLLYVMNSRLNSLVTLDDAIWNEII